MSDQMPTPYTKRIFVGIAVRWTQGEGLISFHLVDVDGMDWPSYGTQAFLACMPDKSRRQRRQI